MNIKSITTLVSLLCLVLITNAQFQLKVNIPGIKYEDNYSFDASVEMDMEFYSKKGSLRSTIPYETYYSEDYKYICVHIKRGSSYQTLFDFPNNNCLILLGDGNNLQANAAVMKDKKERTLNKLPLTKTDKTKVILGYTCNQYTFNVDKFYGEIWATSAINLPNDVGVLKASKMGKYYEDVPLEDFILEITSTTPNGLKTIMKTKAIHKNKKHKINIPSECSKAVNKIDYYDY